MVKFKIMRNVINPNQLDIFDPWDFLTPKRRQMLDAGWQAYFKSISCHSFLLVA